MNTLQMVRDCVRESTLLFCEDGASCINTDDVAKRINISRSVASKYLNQLTSEKALIKITTRPVVFFDCKIIETKKNVDISDYEFLSIQEFINYIQARTRMDGFEEMVGYKGSLNEAVIKLKSHIKYPTEKGLPVVIAGEKGTGKKMMAECLFHYAQNEGLIEENKKFYVFNCLREKGDTRLRLFGRNEKDRQEIGYLEAASGGMLYINNADCLDIHCQNDLASYLEDGYIHRDKKAKKIRVCIVLSTTKNPKEVLCARLLEQVSASVVLPILKERTFREKEKLVHRFLSEEARKLSKEIFVSNYVFNALIRYGYENNIDGMIQAVKTTCANASYSASQKGKNIEIYMYHLPEEIMHLSLDEDLSEDKHMLRLKEMRNNLWFDNIMVYYNEVLARYHEYCSGSLDEKTFIRKTHEVLNRYCDFIIFEKNPYNQRMESYKGIIDNIFDIISSKYKVVIYSNCAYLLAKIIYKLTYVDDDVQAWERANKAALNEIMNIFMSSYRDEYFIAGELAEFIYKTLDIELNSMNLIFLIMNIHFYNKSANKNRIFGLIVAHGYSTASSIADSVNRLLGQQVFNAIDMPLDVTVDGVIESVKKIVKKKFYYNEMILLVDMGSLEQMGSMLVDIGNLRIGVLDNISTKVALAVGAKIIDDMDMETTLSSVCKEATCKYRIFENKKKEAILFTTETGVLSTDRVIEVFKASIPKKVNIQFLSYDHNALVKRGKEEPVFGEYNVLLIAGTIEVAVEDVPYMAIEDVIAFKDMQKLNDIFSQYLNPEEIRVFNNNLIKNFSLGNIMQSLTILNANILLDYIERAVTNLQRGLTLSLDSKIVLRLYIHISCLVERLVTKEPMLKYSELNRFEVEHSVFIHEFKKNFRELCEHYNVEIPLSEIAYLYDYIFSDCI